MFVRVHAFMSSAGRCVRLPGLARNKVCSASTRVRYTQAAVAAYLIEFEVWRCKTSQIARCFLSPKVRALPCLCMTPER